MDCWTAGWLDPTLDRRGHRPECRGCSRQCASLWGLRQRRAARCAHRRGSSTPYSASQVSRSSHDAHSKSGFEHTFPAQVPSSFLLVKATPLYFDTNDFDEYIFKRLAKLKVSPGRSRPGPDAGAWVSSLYARPDRRMCPGETPPTATTGQTRRRHHCRLR